MLVTFCLPTLHLGDKRPQSVTRSAAAALLAATVLGIAGCGGGNSAPRAPATALFVSDGAGETVVASGIETGATSKVVAVTSTPGAVVALFPDGRAFYSPDGFNLGGGGATVAAYSGSLQVIDVVPVSGGVDALLSTGAVYFSPDGTHLGGGGATVSANPASQPVASLTQVGSGIDSVLLNGGGIYFSPDGRNLTGGGSSVRIYSGSRGLLQIVTVGPGDGVVSLFAGGTAYYSPDNRQIGGGGNTVAAAPGACVAKLAKVSGGALAQLSTGVVYLSPSGKNLSGGGMTVRVPGWDASITDGPFPARDSAHGALFLDHLWLSGGFADPTSSDSCFVTCSFFDLWSSVDARGATWNQTPTFATASSPDPRDVDPVVNNGVTDAPVPTDFYDSYSALVVWNNQLIAIGATVWVSADGVHWTPNYLSDGVTLAPGPAPIRATENSRALVLGSTLFFLQPDIGEVYSSTDANAATWTDLGSIPGFAPRCGAAAFVLQGQLWIEGGGACDYSQVYNEIWMSADGVHWTRNASPARWSARMWPCVATGGDGVMWLAGGYAPTDYNNTSGLAVRYGANHSDVWYTKDGSNWRQLKADSGSGLYDDGVLEPRHAPTCYVTDDNGLSLVIVAGTGGPDPNDANARVLNSIRALALPAAQSLP